MTTRKQLAVLGLAVGALAVGACRDASVQQTSNADNPSDAGDASTSSPTGVKSSSGTATARPTAATDLDASAPLNSDAAEPTALQADAEAPEVTTDTATNSDNPAGSTSSPEATSSAAASQSVSATASNLPASSVSATPSASATLSASSTSPSASASSSGGPAAPSNKWGVIALTQTTQSIAGIGQFTASGAVASFGLGAGDTGVDGCVETVRGGCRLQTCAPTPPPETNPMPPALSNAGDVTISGLEVAVSLNSLGSGSYISNSYAFALWSQPVVATLDVSGSNEVPAFNLDLNTPNPIHVTSPLLDNGAYAIAGDQDLTVEWSGGANGIVTVNLSSGNAADGQATISCTADAADGTLSVPQDLLAALSATDTYFAAGVSSVVTKDVGDWLMQFQATTLQDQGAVTFYLVE